MEIHASATCKYLKHKDRSKEDLAKCCLSLKLVAMNSEDAKILTAMYHLYTDGGKIRVECPKTNLVVEGELNGLSS